MLPHLSTTYTEVSEFLHQNFRKASSKYLKYKIDIASERQPVSDCAYVITTNKFSKRRPGWSGGISFTLKLLKAHI